MTFVIDNARGICFSPETAIPSENPYSSLDALFHEENAQDVPEELRDWVFGDDRRRDCYGKVALAGASAGLRER